MTISATGNLLTPSGALASISFPPGVMSQYMDENASVFTDPAMAACGGYVPGCGIGFGANIDSMGTMSDNMTSLQFKFRSNQHVLGSYGEIMQKNMPEMAEALRNGELGKATMLYDELYDAIAKNYGEEITTQEQRVKYDQAIKATIARTYQQINGRPLAADIRMNDESYFANGFKQAISLGMHHGKTPEEVESYMLGTGIEFYGAKKTEKVAGRLIGGAIGWGALATIGGFALKGTAVGGLWGAAIGACLGVALTLIGSASSKPTKITEAY